MVLDCITIFLLKYFQLFIIKQLKNLKTQQAFRPAEFCLERHNDVALAAIVQHKEYFACCFVRDFRHYRSVAFCDIFGYCSILNVSAGKEEFACVWILNYVEFRVLVEVFKLFNGPSLVVGEIVFFHCCVCFRKVMRQYCLTTGGSTPVAKGWGRWGWCILTLWQYIKNFKKFSN